jgi:glycosyltransferase involved in cell wall biosynthesis
VVATQRVDPLHPALAATVPKLAAPLSRTLGQPLLLWYTHWNPTRELRLATRLCTTVLSADAASFPLTTPKLRAIGHGIDVARFDIEHPPAGGRLRVAALGRLSPMKRYPTLLRAVRLLADDGVDVTLTIRGPSLTAEERAHRGRVEEEVSRLGLSDRVEIGDAIPWGDVPATLAAADVLANLAEAADKIVYEAAAARTLPVASAPAFAGFLPDELRFPRDDAAGLAARLAALAARSPAEREGLAATLRARVVAEHSVGSWADAVVDAAGLQRP